MAKPLNTRCGSPILEAFGALVLLEPRDEMDAQRTPRYFIIKFCSGSASLPTAPAARRTANQSVLGYTALPTLSPAASFVPRCMVRRTLKALSRNTTILPGLRGALVEISCACSVEA